MLFSFVIAASWWESGFGRVGNSYELDLVIDSLGSANINVSPCISLLVHREYLLGRDKFILLGFKTLAVPQLLTRSYFGLFFLEILGFCL